MADLLPFAKREPRVRPSTQASPHRTFDQVMFHTPLNQQEITSRTSKEGFVKQVEMKMNVRNIDGRFDQVKRNRMNMFNEANVVRDRTIKPPPPLERATRHGMTPYHYDTKWINHPPENTSLSPLKNEAYLTSFLEAPNSVYDKNKRAQTSHAKLTSIRNNENKFMSYVESIDNTIKNKDQQNINDIRRQRGRYQSMLEERQKLERIRYF